MPRPARKGTRSLPAGRRPSVEAIQRKCFLKFRHGMVQASAVPSMHDPERRLAMTALDDPSSRSFARLAGSLYLLIGFAGVFSIIWVPSQLTVSGDPFGTAALIAQRRGLFAAGVGADVVLMLAEVMLSVMLYAMFRSHGHVLALTAAAARLLMVAVMAAMLLPQAGILALVAQDTQFVALDSDERADRLGAARDR